MYNVTITDEPGKVNPRAKELQDAMAGIAIEAKPTFYDTLGEAVRLGGKAYRGRTIFDALVVMRCYVAKSAKDLLSEIKKDINDG